MAEDIIEYVMHTPGNTNPIILKQMLDNITKKETEKVSFKVTIVNDTTNSIYTQLNPCINNYTYSSIYASSVDPNSNKNYNMVNQYQNSNYKAEIYIQTTSSLSSNNFTCSSSNWTITNDSGYKKISYIDSTPNTEDIIITVAPK